MQLSDLIISPRLRDSWSALDLGISVGKLFWWQHFWIWFFFALPIYVSLTFFTAEIYVWLAIFVVWWLKPLFERPLLFMLSRQLFGEKVRWQDVIKNWKLWLKPGLFLSLTLRRLSPSRSFLLAVILLEQLTGRSYSQRVNVLSAKAGSPAMWLTLTLVHFEIFIPLAIFSLLYFFFPFFEFNFEAWIEQSYREALIANSLSFLAMAMIAPFYVCSGFMLYICRRMELEGWDIEICFRNLDKEKQEQRQSFSVAPVQEEQKEEQSAQT